MPINDEKRVNREDSPEITAKWTIKDSVFTHLFREKKYAVQLYKALHPEDSDVTEDEISVVTLENILLNQPYNDLGFTVRDRLLILVEAQSTWSVNILVRCLLYAAQSIQQHITETKQSLYRSKRVSIPKPEFYVIFTGERKSHPARLKMSEEFFDGCECALDISLEMIYDGMPGDIINQYIAFTRISQEQVRLHGRTQKAVIETIRICKNNDVLKSYLELREKEIIDIMMTLFNKEQIVSAFLEQERQEARAEGRMQGRDEGRKEGRKEGNLVGRSEKARETALRMNKKGMEIGEISELVGCSVDLVKEWIECDGDALNDE